MSQATGQIDAAPAAAAELPQAGALTAEQLAEIRLARQRGTKITRAAGVAAFSGWTMAVFAGITLLFGLANLVSFLMGAALSVLAYIEVKGSKRIRALDASAPIHLGFNQIALTVVICLYCAWGIIQVVFGPSPYESYLNQGGDVAELIQPIDNMNRAIMSAFYVVLAGISVIAQGCAALYYFTRRRHIVTYLKQTPDWVVEMLRVVAH